MTSHVLNSHTTPTISKQIQLRDTRFRKKRIINIRDHDFFAKDVPDQWILSFYKIRIIRKDNFKTFLANTLDIEVTMTAKAPRKIIKFEKIIRLITGIFQNIIYVLQKNSSALDKVRFILRSPSLEYAISTNLLPINDKNLVDLILYEICRVLQSNENFELTGLILNILHLSGEAYRHDISERYMLTNQK